MKFKVGDTVKGLGGQFTITNISNGKLSLSLNDEFTFHEWLTEDGRCSEQLEPCIELVSRPKTKITFYSGYSVVDRNNGYSIDGLLILSESIAKEVFRDCDGIATIIIEE